MKSKIASSPWIFAASKFPNASFSIVKKFSAICLASRDKFKYAAARKSKFRNHKYKTEIKNLTNEFLDSAG